MHRLKIKNMVCDRCVATVEQALESLGAQVLHVALGEARYTNDLPLSKVDEVLTKHGFERLKETQDVLVEEMKLFMQSLFSQLPLALNSKLSVLLSQHFATNYESLSKLFSQHEKLTIERYFLLLKIEKAKELVQYGDRNFTEIAQVLAYAHVNHLSKQFKDHVGMSLTDYKKQQSSQRKAIDKIV